jgi:hypothetical protein
MHDELARVCAGEITHRIGTTIRALYLIFG